MNRTIRVGFSLCLFICFMVASASGGALAAKPLSGKKILIVLAPRNFQENEYSAVRKVFEEAGASVVVASTQTGTAKGAGGMKVPVANLVAKVRAADYSAVVFIGGPGVMVLWDDRSVHSLVREAALKGRVLGAICLAPVALARAGVLKGKNATVWSDSADDLKEMGAKYADKKVVTDGLIVTCSASDSADAFAKAVAALLK